MNSKFRFTMNVVTVLVVFALSAILAVPVFADESTPPVETAESAPPAEETAVEPGPEEAPTEATPPAEESAAEPGPEAITPDIVPVGEEATLSEEPTAAELIEQLPEGTEVVVIDEDGEALPFATQEAAEAIEFHDPMWCPSGVTPFGAGCSIDYGSLEDLVNDIIVAGNLLPSGNGVIWIQAPDPLFPGTPDPSVNPIVIDGAHANFASAVNFSLTLKGGWSGGANTTVDINNPSFFDVPITIINWKGNVTLSNITIADTDSSVGTEDTALFIETTKNIQLDNVTVDGNDNLDASFDRNGAFLDNSGGTGTVVINNGAFNDNEGDGLIVLSTGTVAINGLVAHNNDEDGAFINNTFALTDKAVTLKGFKHFSNNVGNGLEIRTDGALTMSNLVANSNGGDGVILNNSTSIGNLGVTLSGTNYFTGNGGTGLDVLSHGNILISNLNAMDNDLEGAVLDNCDLLSCSVILAKNVKLTGINTFSDNLLEGLKIRSFGSIFLANLTSIDNGGDGAYIDNKIANGNLIDSIGTLVFTGYSVFTGNTGDGLEARSNGSMSFVYVTANDNLGGQGVEIVAVKPGTGMANVTMTGLNLFMDNQDTGLEIEADGRVALYHITANNNGNSGVHITNNSAVGQSVVLYGTNRFNENGTDGLNVDSNGPITVYTMTASENGGSGATLSNDVNPLKPYNVTVTGTTVLNRNGTDGLHVTSFGTITVAYLTANGNGAGTVNGSGVYLDNCIDDFDLDPDCDVATPKAVTLSAYVRTSDNLDNGVYVYSLGLVTLSNILANGNDANGVFVDNSNDPLKPQNVTLNGVNIFNGNVDSGLSVESYGIITAYNLTAHGNGADGAYLVNCFGSGPGVGCAVVTVKGITLAGVSSFVGNFNNGLYVDANGAVSLTRVTAEENGDSAGEDGIKAYARTSITLTCGLTINNLFGSGYDLTAGTSLAIKGIYSNFNSLADVESFVTTKTKTKPCLLP